MIEMLGVLAIIGILSAGGIMGYSVAMENYRGNKLIDEINNAVMQLKYLFKDNSNVSLAFNLPKLMELGVFSNKGKEITGASYKNFYDVPIYASFALRPQGRFLIVWFFSSPKLCVQMITRRWDNVSPKIDLESYPYFGSWTKIDAPVNTSLAEKICISLADIHTKLNPDGKRTWFLLRFYF